MLLPPLFPRDKRYDVHSWGVLILRLKIRLMMLVFMIKIKLCFHRSVGSHSAASSASVGGDGASELQEPTNTRKTKLHIKPVC